MRLLKIASYYKGFLEYYYVKHKNIKDRSYKEQYDHLMLQYFAWSDNYGRLLEQKGCVTLEIIANAEYLQKQWAIEFGLGNDLSLQDILLHQIKEFKPDVIYFQDSITYNGVFVKKIKSENPFVKLCIGNLCAPFSSMQLESFSVFDFFTVCSPLFQKQLKKYGIDSVIIPHAFDKRILSSINSENNFDSTSFIFLGSIFSDSGFHSERKRLLENLITGNVDLRIYGNTPDLSRIALKKRQASYLAAKMLVNIGLRSVAESITLIRKGLVHKTMPEGLKLSKELYNSIREPVFGLDMFKALSSADIGFNSHIDCAGEYAANMRMFETTGVGTCLITDWKKNINEFFEDDFEVVTYKSVDECIEKVRWLVDNSEKCKEIAKNGQRRTLKQHNFENRVELFYEYVKRFL